MEIVAVFMLSHVGKHVRVSFYVGHVIIIFGIILPALTTIIQNEDLYRIPRFQQVRERKCFASVCSLSAVMWFFIWVVQYMSFSKLDWREKGKRQNLFITLSAVPFLLWMGFLLFLCYTIPPPRARTGSLYPTAALCDDDLSTFKQWDAPE